MACLKSHGECRNGTVGVMTEGRTAKPFLMACRVEHGADSKAWWGGMPLVNPRKRSKKIISKNLRIRTNQKKSPCSNFISLERTAFSAFFVMWIRFQPLQKKRYSFLFFSCEMLTFGRDIRGKSVREESSAPLVRPFGRRLQGSLFRSVKTRVRIIVANLWNGCRFVESVFSPIE